MDITDAIKNIQNENYSFMEEYSIEPQNKEEHESFLNFCIEKGITLVSGKSPKIIPYNESFHNKYKFAFIHSKYGINLTYDTVRSFRKKITVKDFLAICLIKGI